MFKLNLKRKLPSRELRKALKTEVLTSDYDTYLKTGEIVVEKINKRPCRFKYEHNKPIGRKYAPALYELEEKSNRKTGLGGDTGGRVVYDLIKECKKHKKRLKLKRIYKAFPYHDPKTKAKREHEKKVAEWQAKLKKNEHLQV